MGPGPSLAGDVALNTVLDAAQRARFQNPRVIQRLLREARTIAVVGLSTDPQRASWFVANYLQREGYRIIPVNPKADRILGERCYPSLAAIGEPVDLVDVFRRPEDLPAVTADAIAAGARAIWYQLRLISFEAAETAERAGLTVVLDRCIKMEHGRYCGRLHKAGMNTELISARRLRH